MAAWTKDTIQELKAELEKQDRRAPRPGLAVPGLETILLAIAEKILVSASASVAAKAATAGAKAAATQVSGPKDLTTLEAQLVSLKPLLREGVMEEANLRKIEKELVDNGTPKDQAPALAKKLAAIIQRRANE